MHDQSPAKAIPMPIWESYRQIIERLYVDDGLKLSEVRDLMQGQYGFDATESMYKKRLRRWGLRKNYTQCQKVKALQDIYDANASGRDPSYLQLNRKPLKRHRLRRPVRQSGCRVDLVSQNVSESSEQCHQSQSHTHQIESSGLEIQDLVNSLPISRRQLQHSNETYNDEMLLRFVWKYYEWFETQTQLRSHYDYTAEIRDFALEMTGGLYCLPASTKEAFALFNMACSRFRSILQTQPYHLLINIFMEFMCKNWQGWYQVRTILLQFLAATAAQTYSTEHPISKITALLAATATTHEVPIASLMKVTVDRTKSLKGADIYFDFRTLYVHNCRDVGAIDVANVACHELVSDTYHSYTPQDRKYRDALRLNAWLHNRNKNYDHSIILHHQALQAINKTRGNPTLFEEGIADYEDLAWNYYRSGQLDQGKFYLTLAIEGYIRLEEADGKVRTSMLLHCLSGLEDLLEEHGKKKEAIELRQEYAHVWARLKQWRLDSDHPDLP